MSFEPNWVSVPGTTINAVLQEKGISYTDFSKRGNWSVETVNKIISGELAINEEIALTLQNILGSSKDFWLSRQSNYDQRLKKIEAEKEEWVKQLPVNEMLKLGWIKKSPNLFKECLTFFNASNIYDWKKKYETKVVSFRKTDTFDSNIASITAWIRKAEIQVENYNVKKWDKELFENTLEDKIKPLTRIKNPTVFIPKLVKICADCGVLLAIIPCIGKSRASGASMMTSENKALIIQSFRYMSDDHFWFTFFHEAGHLIMHENKLRLEDIDESNCKNEEWEANIFSSECLVPLYLKNELVKLNHSKRHIVEFAQKANISPGIVVGQLQHLGIIRHDYLNSYKRRYDWDDINHGINNIHLS
jgi:Plasmid maintenance system antidote protein